MTIREFRIAFIRGHNKGIADAARKAEQAGEFDLMQSIRSIEVPSNNEIDAVYHSLTRRLSHARALDDRS